LYNSFILVLLQLCGRSTIKQFYFTFILILLQLCGRLNRELPDFTEAISVEHRRHK